MPKGAITRLIRDRGFGFIKTEQGEDLFFHRNQLQGVDYNSLREGQQVEFEVRQDPSGRPHAMRVRLVQPKGEEHQAQPAGSEATNPGKAMGK